MKFNLAASVKHVTRVLNPDLEIPDSSGGKSSTAPPPGATRTPSSSSSSSPPPSSVSSSPPAAVAPPPPPPSVPSSHNGTKHSSKRSSLSVRRLSRKSAPVCTPQAPKPKPPLSTSTLEAKTTLPAAFKRDYSATATQDPTLRSYPPPISSTRRSRASTITATSGRSTYRSKLDPAATAETTTAISYLGLQSLTSPSHTSSVPPAAPAQQGTATCLCGAVHLAFPITTPGLVASFVCYCLDCRKGGAEASIVVKDDHLKYLRGSSNLASFSQPASTPSSHTSTTFFCHTCGSNMYRVGAAFPGCTIIRMGTVDDARLIEGRLRPTRELCVKEKASWAGGVKGEEVKRRVGLFS